jgi:hypothetical protein
MRFFARRTPKTPNIVLQNLDDGATPTRVPHKQPPWWSRIWTCFKSLLPKLRLPVAVLIGANITAFTTFALVRHVQHEIANAKVSSDPNKWMQIARTEVYDACYDGCNDCRNTDWAYNACKMTTRANVTGVICDGNLMWNWAARYPTECLKAVGEIYKAEALRKLKQTYRNQLAVIILTVLAGIIGAVIICKIWSCIAARCQTRARSHPSDDPSRYQAADNEPSPPPYFPPRYQAAGNAPNPPPYFPPRMRGGGRGASRSAGHIALITAVFASIVSRSRAYPCTGYNPHSRPILHQRQQDSLRRSAWLVLRLLRLHMQLCSLLLEYRQLAADVHHHLQHLHSVLCGAHGIRERGFRACQGLRV